jgi:hypothetical protein
MACEYNFTNEKIGFGKDADIFLIEKEKKKYALKKFKQPSAIYNPVEVDIQFKLKNEFLIKGEDILPPGICDMNSPGLVSQLYSIRLKDQLQYLSYKEKKNIMIDLAKGMRCLHNNKYLYLDCKLENCMLKKEKDGYKGVLIDFGLSSYIPKEIEKGILTIQRRINSYYTPPECIKEYDEGYYYNNKSDIWCLGIVFMLILTDNAEYLPDYIVKDTVLPDFTNLAQFYLDNLSESNLFDYMEKNVYDKIRHPEAKNEEERKNILDLMVGMIRINEKKRFTISEVLNRPFFKDTNKVDKCEKETIGNISLKDVEYEYYFGIYTIINYLREHFEKQCVSILFMAIDLYLRNVYKLTLQFKEFNFEEANKLAKNCCLIAFKYYNWSELKNYPKELSEKLYSKDFVKEEAIIYKRLKVINTERYFENAKNKRELKKIYIEFIQESSEPEENIEFIVNDKRYRINDNIVNYLDKDPVDFIRRFDYREKEKIWDIQIRDFFSN